MSDFTITSRRVTADLGFIAAETLTVRTPSGEVVERVAITHPGAVAIVPLDGDDVVLIRQYRSAIADWLLEIPAGKRDSATEAPEVTAKRELREELGVTSCTLEFLTSIVNAPGYCDEVIDIFVATDLVFGADPSPDGDEEVFSQILRMPLTDARQACADGSIRDAKTIVGLSVLQ